MTKNTSTETPPSSPMPPHPAKNHAGEAGVPLKEDLRTSREAERALSEPLSTSPPLEDADSRTDNSDPVIQAEAGDSIVADAEEQRKKNESSHFFTSNLTNDTTLCEKRTAAVKEDRMLQAQEDRDRLTKLEARLDGIDAELRKEAKLYAQTMSASVASRILRMAEAAEYSEPSPRPENQRAIDFAMELKKYL